jgi:hypothetical protein
VIDRKPKTDNVETVLASIDSVAIRDSCAKDKLRIAARMPVYWHPMSNPLVAWLVASSPLGRQ